MDDFGTGYSSLNMLKDLSVDVLKLDKGFMEDAASNEKGQRIIASIVRLAQSLGMTVTAEGVETDEQYRFYCRSAAMRSKGIISRGRWIRTASSVF